MKFIILLVILCGAIHLSEQGLSKDQIIEMERKLLEECSKKEGSSAADLEEVSARRLPSTKSAKCLHACLGETLGLIKDKKTNIDSSVELAKMAYSDGDSKVEIARSIATECHDATDDDRCDAAFKMLTCSIAAAKNHGMEFTDLM